MGEVIFYERIGLPQKLSPIMKKLDKKMFYEYADISRKEKNVITNYVDRFELSYLLTPNTINIQAFINHEYHYEGVMFVTVKLKNRPNNSQIHVLEKMIHKSLPNPVVILFTENEKMLVSTCIKRLNKVKKTEVVLERIHCTRRFLVDEQDEVVGKFIDAITLTNLSFTNFFEFYKEIDLAVKAFQDFSVIGKFKIIKEDEERKRMEMIIEQIKDFEQEYKKTMIAIKKESQFNKKVELNMRAQNIKKQIEMLKREI